MDVRINKMFLKKSFDEPLVRNSFYLMFSTLTSSFSGFFYWVVAARFYSANEVGLAAAIISLLALICVLSLMGFDVSLIKYIPEIKEKDNLINSCLTVSLMVSLLLTIVFILGIDLWSPYLVILKENLILMIIFLISSLILPLQSIQSQGIFVAFRKAKYSFYQSIITFCRIIAVPFLVTYGSIGIFAPFALTSLISFSQGMYFIKKICPYNFKLTFDKHILKKIIRYSGGNYISRVLETLPTFILPIIVINKLGAEANAHFYVAWQISLLILIFSKSISNSLLAEIVHNKDKAKYHIMKAVKLMSILLALFITGIFIFGKYVLMTFGNDYAVSSLPLLRMLVLASIPFSFNTIFVGIMRSKGDSKTAILVYGITTVLSLVGSSIILKNYELLGVAYSWIGANIIASFAVITYLLVKKLNMSYFKVES